MLWRLVMIALFFTTLHGATLTRDISVNKDDAEEWISSGQMYLLSNDLWLASNYLVGLRFQDIGIPPNAIITNAYIRFRANSEETDSTSLRIWMESEDDPVIFSSDKYNISSRSRTTTSLPWNNIGTWSKNSYYKTPNLTSLVQQIIDRPNWTADNAMVFIISSEGFRSSYSKNGGVPPRLVIEYSVAKRAPIMQDIPDQAVFVSTPFSLDLSSYAALTENDPILSYDINGTLPTGLSLNTTTGIINGTATTAGSWTVSATATDVDGVSNAKSFTITVALPAAPVATPNSYDTDLNIAINANVISDGTADTGSNIKVVLPVTAEPANGSLTLKADGSFSYKPDRDYEGDDTFTYTIIDAFGRTSSAQVTITINNKTTYHDGTREFILTNSPETRNIIGNYAILGNTIECITQKRGTESDAYNGTCQNSNAYNDNNYMAKYIDIDGNSGIGASTWNSSSSNFTLPDTYYGNDGGNGILWAGIFWQGAMHNNAGSYKQRRAYLNGSSIAYKNITSDEALNIENSDANKLLIRVDNDTTYKQIQANDLYYDTAFGDEGGYYAGYTDITAWLQSKNLATGKHTITVANLSTNEGREDNTGNYGGWSIVVIYKEKAAPDAKARNISIYKGYTVIPNKRTVKISGFRLPSAGRVNAQFSAFAGEGEEIYGGSSSSYDRMVISKNADLSGSQNMPGAIDADNIFDAILAGIDRDSGNDNAMTGNNNGIDVENYDVSNIMTTYRDADNKIDTVYIGLSSNNDYITPSMMAFSAELYKPKLCYDYAYKQGSRYFTEENNGTQSPRIVGSALNTSLPVDVELYIQNKEASDITLSDMTLNIQQINTAQAIYKPNSTSVVAPGEVFLEPHNDTQYGESYNNNIRVGKSGIVDSLEYFYLYYALTLRSSDIDMPLVVELNYNLNITGANTFPTVTYTTTLPMCSTENFNYTPAYGIFNVEDRALSYSGGSGDYRFDTTKSGYYNLPTQTVNRAGDFVVAAYDANNSLTRIKTSTVVAVEMIGSKGFHDLAPQCDNPRASTTPRIWVVLENNATRADFDANVIRNAITNGTISDAILNSNSRITTPGQFYSMANENTAFRVSYNGAGNGELIKINPVPCKGGSGTCYDVGNFTEIIKYNEGQCKQDVDGNPKNMDRIASFCDNAGGGAGANMTQAELATCMECVYGFEVNFLCSRDNFAIRPESFRMALNDQNNTDSSAQQKRIALNNDTTKVHKNNNTIDPDAYQVAAGYRYNLEVNATNYQNEMPAVGYDAVFSTDTDQSDRYLSLRWLDGTYNNNCNDISDQNFSARFAEGRLDFNISSTNVGKYNLTIFDKEWTSVDWNQKYRGHHKTGRVTMNGIVVDGVDVRSYFIEGGSVGTDCVPNTSAVPLEGTLTGVKGVNLQNVSGCNITSNKHRSLVTDGNENLPRDFTDIPLHFHPYTFNTDGLSPSIGPRGQAYVYIDTPPLLDRDDFNMSYNLNGTFYAAGFDQSRLSNFVDGCYASDVNMSLRFAYNHAQPADIAPFLSYSLKNHNTINPSIRYRPIGGDDDFEVATHDSITTPFLITQEEQYFQKDMNGSITMNLGYNFNRTNNAPLNPRDVNMSDFNITYVNRPTNVRADLSDDHVIFGNRSLNQNLSFIYGRAKPSKELYDDVTTQTIATPVVVVGYCDLNNTACRERGIDTLFGQTSDNRWWRMNDHQALNANQDGRLGLQEDATIAYGSGTASLAPKNPLSGTGEFAIVSARSADASLPLTAAYNLNVDFSTPDYTNRWLIFNPDSATLPPVPFYRVRFIGGNSQWAGVGYTGNVVDTNASPQKTKRMDW